MSAKPLRVKRIKGCVSESDADVGRCLESQTDENSIARLNWSAYPYKPNVSFRIGHVEKEVLLKFDVAEERVRALETRTHGEVYKDSCVEFFISFDRTNYYNFEFNCIGTPHLAYGPAREHRTFLPLSLTERLVIHSSLGTQPFAEKAGFFKWTLSVRIPVACFAFDAIASLSGVQASANFYKVGSGLTVPHYVTWNPIHTPTPDYHRPEFFGSVLFEH